jgi:hypothetical protein
MVKRVTDRKYALVIAFFACGFSFGAQDSTQSTTVNKEAQAAVQPSQKPAVPDSIQKKTAIQQTQPAAKPSPAPAQPAKTSQILQKKKTAGEDILDEEDLILPEKGEDLPVKKAAREGPMKPTDTSQEKTAARTAGDTVGPVVDSSAAGAASSSQPTSAAPAANAPAAQPAKSVTIEDARSINFARNLKDYRSPKLAMLLSLCVPGLGQIYIGKRSNYIKAGAYVAVEAAIIGVSAYYFNRGDHKYNQAKDFANSNYSVDDMLAYYNDLYDLIKKDPQGNMTDSFTQGKLNDIYVDTITSSKSSFLTSYNNKHPSQDYYHMIENGEYMHGWKGCEPSIADIGKVASGDTIKNPTYRFFYQRAPDSSGNYLVNLIDSATGKAVPGSDNELQYGYSPYQRDYKAMMNQSNSYYKTATYVLFVLLVNHVASAVDALISAKAYNDGLLGRQTFWRNLSIEPTTAFSGTYLSPGLTMRVLF